MLKHIIPEKSPKMNPILPQIIDSHVHLDILYRVNPSQVAWMKENRYVPISWSYASRPDSVDSIRRYLNRHAEFVQQQNLRQVPCFYMAGIHPRCISPDLRPRHLSDLLSPFLSDPLCLGLGEIGLETGNDLEQDIFSAQLELFQTVKEAGKRLGIHTPRSNKKEITELTLTLLAPFPGIESISVIDHCTIETLPSVLAGGFHAGITLSPAKTSHEDLETIIENHEKDVNRMMCNTDSGGNLFNDLYRFYLSDVVSNPTRNQLARNTALSFFPIKGDQSG